MNNKDETIVIKLTEKGKQLNDAIEEVFEKWLEASEMTREELLSYKDIKGFHIVDDDTGYYLAYYKKGIEKQIGVGLYKEQLLEAEWIFGYICAILDSGSNYKSSFSKEFMKWGTKHE